MGHLIEGRWSDEWYDTASTGGVFRRTQAQWRNWITPDGAPGPSGSGGFTPDSGRYHLYVSHACPWAHRVMIVRALMGLEGQIGVSVVHPDMLGQGWEFRTDFPGATGDALFGAQALHQIYTRADPQASCRVTVPVLWDTQRGMIVSNESSEIIRMLAAFGQGPDLWPEDLRAGLEPVNARIYETLNNGVYLSGFATTQAAYDAAVGPLFDTLDWLEERLSRQRWLMGARLTEGDIRLFTTLVRFDAVYHGHFKCNRRRIVDYPALWGFTREVFQMPGVAGTVHMDHITRHYHYSHDTINPHRIVPVGPMLDFMAPHGRGGL